MSLSRHVTNDGRVLSVFQMDSQHIENCIRRWKKNLGLQNYKKPNFVEIKIKLYTKVLENRNHEVFKISKRNKKSSKESDRTTG